MTNEMGSTYDIIKEMKEFGINVPSNKVFTGVQNAEQWFRFTLESLFNQRAKKAIYKDEYNEIIEWLTDNKGKGLILMGGVGLGKTIIARFVIPYIFKKVLNRGAKFHSAVKINTMDDVRKLLDHKIIIIDDIGTEEVINEYGNKIDPLPLIIDEAEKENKLLILTTNLNRSYLLDKYKDRAYDRLMSLCKLVILKGESLRDK